MIHRFVAMLALAGLIAPLARASDFATDKTSSWHHWRGPNADGTAPAANPPTKWDAKTNIKWRVDRPGRGRATPVNATRPDSEGQHSVAKSLKLVTASPPRPGRVLSDDA